MFGIRIACSILLHSVPSRVHSTASARVSFLRQTPSTNTPFPSDQNNPNIIVIFIIIMAKKNNNVLMEGNQNHLKTQEGDEPLLLPSIPRSTATMSSSQHTHEHDPTETAVQDILPGFDDSIMDHLAADEHWNQAMRAQRRITSNLHNQHNHNMSPPLSDAEEETAEQQHDPAAIRMHATNHPCEARSDGDQNIGAATIKMQLRNRFDSQHSKHTGQKAHVASAAKPVTSTSSVATTSTRPKRAASLLAAHPYSDDDDDDDDISSEQQQPPQRPTKKRKRIRKKYEPEIREYVEYTDEDVLCQRGGLANKHPGNLRYHGKKETLQPPYEAAEKAGKGAVAQQLVDAVKAWGGRFLEKEEFTDRWYIIHDKKARIKASQAL